MRGASTVTLAAFAARALADTHTLYAGFFAGTTLVRLEFDDSTNALTLVENITAPNTSGQKWIALDVCSATISPCCKTRILTFDM